MISPLANIHPNAKIGTGVTIEAFASVYGDVVIGDNTWVGPNVTIFDGARIGSGVRIFPGAVISAIPQDLKFAGEQTTAEIGDNTVIREMVTVNRGTSALGKTVIGSNCLLMAYVHIAHDCMLGNQVILANSVNLAGHVTIDDWAILEGYVRRGFDQESINVVQDLYRLLYNKGYSTRNALDIIEKEIPSHKLKDEIIEFIQASDNGIMRGYSGGDND